MCVCTICIDVKLQLIAGGQQPIFLCCPTKLRKMWWMGSWSHEPVPALLMYIYIVPPLGAYKPQLGGHISYRCCFIRSMSPVIIRLYIYILINFHSSCQFTVGVFCTFVTFHIKIRNDCSEQVCDSCWIRQGGMNPSGNAFLSKMWMQRPDV